MSDHAFENTYDLSEDQLIKLDEAEEKMLRNNLGRAEEILLEMLEDDEECIPCLLYTSPSPRDATLSRMPSSA